MRFMDKLKFIQRIIIEYVSSCMDIRIIQFITYFRLVLQNTRFLQIFSLFDVRIKFLVYIIRYWVKLKGIAGNFQVCNRLFFYVFIMLVIYYLMNITFSILFSVEEFFRMCGQQKIKFFKFQKNKLLFIFILYIIWLNIVIEIY